jgi:hypothetical protein
MEALGRKPPQQAQEPAPPPQETPAAEQRPQEPLRVQVNAPILTPADVMDSIQGDLNTVAAHRPADPDAPAPVSDVHADQALLGRASNAIEYLRTRVADGPERERYDALTQQHATLHQTLQGEVQTQVANLDLAIRRGPEPIDEVNWDLTMLEQTVARRQARGTWADETQRQHDQDLVAQVRRGIEQLQPPAGTPPDPRLARLTDRLGVAQGQLEGEPAAAWQGTPLDQVERGIRLLEDGVRKVEAQGSRVPGWSMRPPGRATSP